jgi:hypothetical protein
MLLLIALLSVISDGKHYPNLIHVKDLNNTTKTQETNLPYFTEFLLYEQALELG